MQAAVMRRRLNWYEQLRADIAHLHNDLRIIMAAIDDLTASVSTNTTVIGSAITLIQGLKSQLDAIIAAGNNDPALVDLAAQLGASDTALADAVTANTPAAPPTP